MYWNYLKYLIEHKWNVGIECIKMGMYLHAITHDLSKFLPSEFKAYAWKFYGDYSVFGYHAEQEREERDKDFDKAWCLHQHRNKHHWNYWVKSDGIPVPMSRKYVRQMIADWRGMARKFGDTANQYYLSNKGSMILHDTTIEIISLELNL